MNANKNPADASTPTGLDCTQAVGPNTCLDNSILPPTGRNSTMDTDTPLPAPLPLHESTTHDSMVEMAEVLTGPSRSSPSSPALPVPPSLLAPIRPGVIIGAA